MLLKYLDKGKVPVVADLDQFVTANKLDIPKSLKKDDKVSRKESKKDYSHSLTVRWTKFSQKFREWMAAITPGWRKARHLKPTKTRP